MANTTDDNLGDGGSTDDGSTTNDGSTTTNSGGGGGFSITRVVNIFRSGDIRALLVVFLGTGAVNTLVGTDGKGGLLNNPKEFIYSVIEDWLFNTVLRPIAESLWNGGVAIVDAVTIVFFGGNYKIGHPGTTQVGILDLPFLITGPIGGSYLSIGDAISAAIESVNTPIIESMSQLGLAAPFVAPALITFEIVAAAWATWTIISLVDIPGVRIMAGIKAALKPVTNLVRWLLE